MIIDCFPYFNEKELLELRIKLLYDKVDKFVVTEGDHTHKGDPKPFTFLDTARQLNLPMDKIIYVQVALPSAAENPNAWVRERMQRNAASKFINEGDVAFIGDADEIMNPDFIEYYAKMCIKFPSNVLRVPLVFLCSKANLRVHDQRGKHIPWSSPFMVMKHHVKEYTLSDIRESHALNKNNIKFGDIFITEDGVVQEAGWHFTWMGDSERRNQKLKAFLHWDEVKLTDNYKAHGGSLDPLGRHDHILFDYPKANLPALIDTLPRVNKFLFDEVEEKILVDLKEKDNRYDNIIPGVNKISMTNFEYKKQPVKDLYKEPQLGEISVVQLGTNRAYDNLSETLIANYSNINGVFVEANSIHLDSIRECYKKYKNIIIENVAIKPSKYDKLESLDFYINTNDGPNYEIASTDINHILKHMEFVEHIKDGSIEKFTVPCISLEELLEKHNIKNLDLLAIDLEGIDAEVLLNLDLQKFNIKRIEFEHLHLGNLKDKVLEYLQENGYQQKTSAQEFNWAFERNSFVHKSMEHFYTDTNFGEENWFTFTKLYTDMVKEFPSGSKFVEVGSWKGRSSAYMAVEIINSQKNIDFYTIDTWKGAEALEHLKNPELAKEVYNIFTDNMKSVENYYIPIKMESVKAAKHFRDNSLDFVFIDAAHDYENVIADLKTWYPKIRKGGILAGHDFYPDQPTWGGVYKAVTEVFGTHYTHVDGDCFLIRK